VLSTGTCPRAKILKCQLQLQTLASLTCQPSIQSLPKSAILPTHSEHNNRSSIFYIVKRDIKSIFEDSILKSMNRIKEVLEEKGIKQKWLAEKLGKSYNMVNGYVQNRQQPKLEILFEIAEILGVKPQDLIKETK
jgi:putative transcriptional regulator